MKPYLEPSAEFFDRAAVPPEIEELLDEWREIDPGTARLIRAAVMSRELAAAAASLAGAGSAGRTGAGSGIKLAPAPRCGAIGSP